MAVERCCHVGKGPPTGIAEFRNGLVEPRELSLRKKGAAKKSEFPFPLHILNLFIDEFPQDIRVVMYTLLDAVIGIDYNIRQALAAGNTIVRDRWIDLFTVRALTGFQP